MEPTTKQEQLYFHAARKAAHLEQSKHYFEAAINWLHAHQFAKARKNQLWSEHRADYCFMQIHTKKATT